MQISNTFGISAGESLQGAQRSNKLDFAAGAKGDNASITPSDKLDFSPEAQAIISGESATATSRTERIASIRRAIADGSYDSPERLSAALDKFLEAHS